MAKKKKKTILTAEEYKAQNGMLVTADQYRSQQAAANARKQAEEKAAANARSQAMTNSWRKMSQEETYSGGRTAGNTFGTYALKQQYDRAKNKKTFFNDYMNQLAQKRTEANKKLTQDATYLMDGKGDPGIAYRSVMSGADSTDARKRLNKYAQEEKQFNLDVQHAQNERLVKGDYSGIDFGGHMGKYTDDLKETFYLPNVSTRNIEASQLKKRGYGNSGTDWSTYSDNDALQKKKDELLAQKEYYENRHTDPYEALEEKGQFTPVYSAWGESEGTQEAAKRFHQSIKGRNKDDINPQTIMDSIYGSGTYSYETQGMTDIERQRLDDDIMNRFYQMERPETGVDIYGQMEQERKTNEDMTNYLTGEIGRIDRQMEHNNEYNELMNAETGGDRSFHPENDYVSEDPIDVERFDLFYNMTSPSVDVISSFINRGAVYDDWMKVSGRLPDGMKNVAHMLPEEIGKFNEYYNAGQKDKAMAFIEGLQYALGQRNQYYENVQKKYETTQAPILSYLNTFTEKAVLQPAEMLGVIAGRIFGDKRVEDPDSGYWAITNDINKTRQFVTEDMDKITRFFVETGTSAVDSFANVLMGNSMGLSEKALEYTVLGFFGTQAFQTSMNQNLRESNGDWAHSFAEATLDTLIETATEIFSVEKLLSDPTKFLEYLFKNAIAEGSEEFVGATFGPLVHEMLLHNNEWRERAAQIWRDGGYADDNGNFVKVGSEEDAYRQAMKEWNHDIFRSTLSGALSTGGAAMVGGVQNVGNRMFGRYQEAGRQIRNAETAGTNGQQVLLDAALSMKEGTKSNKQAQKIQEKLKANEKISDFEIGKLAENIYKESNEQAAEAARTVIEDNAFEKLEKTKMDVVQSREMARIISEAVMKGGVNNLSRSDRSMLMGSVEGFNVYKDFISFQDETKNSQTVRDTMDAIIDATRESVERQQSVSELLNAREGQAVKQAEDAGEQLASEEDIRNASGAAVEGARGVIVDGQWAKLGNLVEVKEKDAKGNTKTSLRWQISGTDQTVKASQIRATDFSTAAIIRQATVNPGMFSNGFVNTLMKANEQGQIKNVGRFLLDAQKVRMAGYLGMQMPANTMGSQAAQDIYNQAKYEHGKNRDDQLKNGNAGRRGKITFMGAEYGTTEWNQAIKNANLDRNQRAQIDAIAGIAQRAGIEVYFRSAEEVAKEWGTSDPEMTYGWESNTDEHGRGISINIEGLDFALGENGTPEVRGQHNMLVTFGHEMTHWLQRNSANGYNQLESFVMGEMRRNGVNIQRRVMDVMERRGLSIEDAMSEIVADSCDQILANEEVAQHIQETNKGLYSEIKGFVKNLIGRMKDAIKGMDESQSRDARAMMNSANRLAKVWLGAYDEAISGAIKNGNKAEENSDYRTRFSKQMNNGYDYTKPFAQQLEDWKNGLIPKNDVLLVSDTPIEFLQVGLKQLPITINQTHVDYAINNTKDDDHYLTQPVLEQLPYLIKKPIAIIESQSRDDSVVVIVGKKVNKNMLIAAIEVNALGEQNNKRIRTNTINSTFGKSNAVTKLLTDAIQKENAGDVGVFYIDKARAQYLYAKAGVQFPGRAIQDGPIHSIFDVGSPVKMDYKEGRGKNGYRYSQAVIEEDGDEMTLSSLNLARDLYFKGTDAEIEAGEKKLAQREREMKDIIESDDFTALMLKNKAGGRYEILHPSTRKGIRFQLTYYGNDGEPSMHESYGKTGGPVDERENVHSMDELYRHYADMSYDSDLKLQVLRDNARFSQAMIDEEYDQAVKNGDVQREQELVDQAADRNGYTMEVYHGTPTGGFTQFKDWSYFTENKAYADRYNHPSASSIRGYAVEATRPMTYALRMNPGRVFDTRKAKERELFNKARMEYGMTQLQESGVPDWTDGRDLIEYIEENNLPYDTIILDEGGDGGYGEEVVKRGFSYVTRSNMIKSAEPVTYDDQGKVIPLSERFNPEKVDIRWSHAELDSEYDQAVKSGNVERQQELVDEAAEAAMPYSVIRKEDGTLRKLYHGTYSDTFTVFDKDLIGTVREGDTGFFGKGFYFTFHKGEARSYGNNVMEVFVDIRNPFDFRKELNTYNGERANIYGANHAVFAVNWARKFPELNFEEVGVTTKDGERKAISLQQFADEFEDVYKNKEFEVREVKSDEGNYWEALADPRTESYTNEDGETFTWTEYGFRQKFYTEQDARNKTQQTYLYLANTVYDHITIPSSPAIVMSSNLTDVLKERGYDGVIQSEEGDEVVAFESNQIKLADPVTYDDKGKVIPLSERFNKESNDIRFSMAEPVEQVRDLIAVHNLTPQNLLGSLAEDGFTAPSIAVVKAKEGHSKFGTISVVFKRSAIDPLMNRKNKIYGTDAWTPTRSNAQLETEWDYEGLAKVKDRFLDKMKGMEEYYRNEAERWIGQKQYEGATTKQFDDLALEAYGNYGILAAYLAEKGETIEKKYRNDKDHSELHEESIPDYNRFLDALKNEGRLDEFMNDMKHESIYDNIDKWGQFYAENGNDQAKKVYENVLKDEGKRSISARVLGSRLRQFYMFQQDGRKIKTHKEIDRFLMYQAMTEKADRNDFNKWLYNTLKGSIGRTGVYNGVDPYDSYGNERSWEQTHWKPTAENIVKAMYRNHEAKGGEAGGATGLMAKASKEYATIEEVRADRGRLQQIDEEEYKAKVSELDKKIIDFVNRAEETSGWSTDTLRSSLIEAGGEYAKNGERAVRKYFRQEKINLTEEQIQEAISLMNEAKEIETGYFEAKPERVVGLDEIYKVIVPASETEVIDELEKRGIPYETTDGTDEDRLRVLNEQEDARFSKASLDNLDAGAWIGSLTPGQVQTEAERDLINNYKGRRVSIQLSIKKQLDYKAKIKQLTDNLEKLTPAQLDDLKTLQDKLAVEQEKHARLEDELFKITSADGYAGLMYRQNQILNNFILGKTQDQVRQTVDEMVKETQKAKEEIAKQAEELKKLAQTQAVQTMKSYLGKTSLKFAAKSLKSELNSSMKNGEIENRLAEMALKKANGESIAEDARLLAIDMTNQMRGYQLDVMERLRGVTITIGPDEQAEMKGNGMTLASVREQLKGTGVKVKYGDHSSLDTDTQDGGDLRVLLPELPQEISENSADALFRFISWAQSMREGDLAAKQSMVDIDDAALNVMALASTVTTEMTNDPAAKKQIDKLLKQVQDLSGRTEEIAGKMSDVMDQMDNIELAGTKAVGWASVLQRDVHVAIDYYNKIARMAAQEERNTVRKNLIEQLKSENTRKLVEQQEKYQELMKQDRKARELAQDNLSLRNRISTVASRINKRLTAETDQKNVPEEAKPLARQMLKMLLEHDFVYRHVLMANKQQREDSLRAMRAFDQRDGGFDMDRDLDWLIVGQGEDADYDIHDRIVKDLIDIETGLMEYRTAEGHKNLSLMDRREALRKIDKAVTEIWSVIQARETANINHKNMLVSELAMQARDNMDKSRFKGEWTGVIGHGIQGLRSGVVYGNMTPEYFFKNLRNKTISQLYDEYHRAENRNGLEVGRAQKKLAQIAEETGYKNWDPKKRYTFNLVKGGTVNLTLGEMMSLYATWEREKLNQIEANGPEESYHLKVGGFYTQQEEQHKILGREVFNQRAHRLTEEDMTKIMEAMTPEQIEYVDRVVKYMTNEIGALGNEASMRMYGIKKYNEKWYFPFEIWEGVKSKKSDQGAAGNQENRAAHQSFTKRRVNNASNALVIRDFTETAVKHIGQMINYNTFAPAIEFMNRVMNEQMEEAGEGEDSSTKRNLRAMFGEIYGRDAVKYLDDFNKDVNGGVTRPDSSIYDKLLSTFKKSAVAGSMSVALQQPLSYIRAAMLINPKYLATSINVGPQLKRIVEEMRKYSGVAVIKKMGKFDMNLGRSAIDYMKPEAKESTGRTVYNKVSDAVTILPELMDTWTWCNMWEAVKKEQADLNPGMDKTSDAFLEKVAERFNEVMRRTQVYDSMLVKSRNMRSNNVWMKSMTSFMSEPTLTANVLYDAVINAKEKGGKTVLAKAATTFVMSAILQAIVKGLISAGRNPQDKKTWDENVAYRTGANLISELNPLNLLPGYNDLMVLFKEGELNDDALSVVGKILEAGKTGIRWIQGKSENPWYRDLEDTAGVISQLFTNIPAKNLLRDMRAITNYIKKPWADRPNSADVLKYQLLDQIHTADNMTGVLSTWLGDKGWETKNAAYYKRIYQADKAGKQEKVASMINYLTLARGTKETTIKSGLRDLAKKDSSLTGQQRLDMQKQYGLNNANQYITTEYKEGKISRNEAEKMYRKENPKADDKKVYETFDRIDYTKAGKLEDGEYYSSYLPLYDAIEANSQGEIKQAIKKMLSYGYKVDNIKNQLGTKYKNDYIQADTKKRGQIQNKLIKAYRELGISETEAIGIMQKWVTDYSKKQSKKK